MSRYRVRALALGFAATLAWSCVDATDIERLEISASGVLFGVAFVDMDGDSSPSAFDEPIEGVSVIIRATGSTEIVQEATTDALGAFLLEDVPVGTYTVTVDSAFLSDSLATVLGDDPITVQLGDTTRVDLGVSFPELTLEEVRAEVPGRRVFTSGIALNVRQPFGDGQVFFQGASLYLRATNVDRANLNVGDSVRLLGRTAIDNGQPTLDVVTPSVVVSQATIPIVEEITTGVADSANGGPLDAALVRVRNAEITDTSTVNGDFFFWVDDGSGGVETVLRSFLGFNPSAVRPDTILRIREMTGLLAPFDDGTSNVRWRLLPRAPSEIVLETKFADVGVETSFDTAQASLGDTVEIVVTADNAGPLLATGVDVTDTIPSAFTYLSSTATSGSYDPGTSTWTIGSLAVNAADTLRLSVEVATGALGSVLNLVRIGGLDAEVDQNGGNNVGSATITLVTP